MMSCVKLIQLKTTTKFCIESKKQFDLGLFINNVLNFHCSKYQFSGREQLQKGIKEESTYCLRLEEGPVASLVISLKI